MPRIPGFLSPLRGSSLDEIGGSDRFQGLPPLAINRRPSGALRVASEDGNQRPGTSDRLESTGAVPSFAAEIVAPGLRRTPSAGESHAGMANGTDGLDSWTALQFEPGCGVYQGG